MIKKLLCWLWGHKWTTAASQGIKPTQDQLKDWPKGFIDYARSWCSRCGKEHPLNLK